MRGPASCARVATAAVTKAGKASCARLAMATVTEAGEASCACAAAAVAEAWSSCGGVCGCFGFERLEVLRARNWEVQTDLPNPVVNHGLPWLEPDLCTLPNCSLRKTKLNQPVVKLSPITPKPNNPIWQNRTKSTVFDKTIARFTAVVDILLFVPFRALSDLDVQM